MTYTAISDTTYPKEIAKIIRKELKANFTDTKFSVRISRGTVDVSWERGPSEAMVNEIIMKHEGGFTTYIFAHRSISNELYNQIINDFAKLTGKSFDGDGTIRIDDHFSWNDVAHQLASHGDLTEYHGVRSTERNVGAFYSDIYEIY